MTRITINYPLIAARSHYMINYMVIICLRIIVPSCFLTVTKREQKPARDGEQACLHHPDVATGLPARRRGGAAVP